MIFSNLKGTTSNQFMVGSNGDGQLISNNAYDLFWGAHNTATNTQNANIKYVNVGDNMNELLSYGQYSCYASSTAETVVYTPTEYAFVMEVYPSVGVGTSYITQKVTDLLCNVFYRKYDGVWTEWKRIANTPESGSFTLIPYEGAFGNSGDATGVRFTKQKNKYFIVSNIAFIYLSFSMERLTGSTANTPLSFKGLPIPIINYGANIFGNLGMYGIINGINGTTTAFYPTQPHGGLAAADSFSILCEFSSNANKAMFDTVYLYVSDLVAGSPVEVTGSMTIYNTVIL